VFPLPPVLPRLRSGSGLGAIYSFPLGPSLSYLELLKYLFFYIYNIGFAAIETLAERELS